MVIAIVYNNWFANEQLSGSPEDMVEIFRKRFYESSQLVVLNKHAQVQNKKKFKRFYLDNTLFE